MNEIKYGGEANHTYTEDHRDRDRLAASLTPAPQTMAVTATNWPPMALALLRGALEGFVLAGLDITTALSLDFSTRDSLVSGGIVFFGRMAIALGVGGIDAWNAAKERHR